VTRPPEPAPGLEAEALPAGRRAAAAAALQGAGLPADDLERPGVLLLAFRAEGRLAGYGGLELHGAEALLRSVLVLPERRGAGVGRAITERLLRRAAEAGARRVFLLTADAAGFFERLGFARIPREAAPDAIAGTPQMAGLCPSTAALLVRPIA
jgi:GNAT superfamily N-acetyltransferase